MGGPETSLIEPVNGSKAEGSKRRGRWSSLLQPAPFVLTVALIVGMAFALIVPPLQGADERDHLARAYQLATGQITTSQHAGFYGAMLPVGYQDYMAAISKTIFRNPDHTAFLHMITSGSTNGKHVFVDEGTIASYGPGAYVVYLPALALGNLAGLPPGVLMYLARLSGVVAYALILALAVRRLPGFKWLLVSVGLIPEMLNQASTVSADGLTNALTLLMVAWFFRLAEDRQLSRPNLIEIGVTGLLLAAAKPPYFLVTVPLLALAFKHRARPRFSVMGWLLAAALPVFVVAVEYQRRHSSRLDLPGLLLGVNDPTSYAYRDIHTGAQMHALLSAPWRVGAIIFRTVQYQGLRLPNQMIGLLGGYQLPGWLVAISVLSLFVAGAIGWRNHERPGGSRPDAVAMLVTTSVIAVGICVSVYDLADALGAPRIDGLTPRYFLALMPGVLLGLCALRSPSSVASAPSVVPDEPFKTEAAPPHHASLEAWGLPLVLVAVLIATGVGIIHHYYTGPAILR